MFELVDSQPVHMVSVDTFNLTPGKSTLFYSFMYIYIYIFKYRKLSI